MPKSEEIDFLNGLTTSPLVNQTCIDDFSSKKKFWGWGVGAVGVRKLPFSHFEANYLGSWPGNHHNLLPIWNQRSKISQV